MNLTIKWGLSHAWLVPLVFCLTAQAWAAPDYVTAWPKQVAVEKPDPVLGDKPFWELWVYSDAFARRFKGFPVEKADAELKDGIQAAAVRIYKENLWYHLNPGYPEQYACHLDVYFDSSIALPLSQNARRAPREYPQGISPSYMRLMPLDEKDLQSIRGSKPATVNLKTQPLIFADRPLDGRYSSFGVREYHPNLAPRLAVLVLASPIQCSVTAPKAETGVHWLSLFGNRPYDKDDRDSTLWMGLQGGWGPRVKTITFDPVPTPESKGYFRVPEAFYRGVLPKVTLVKVLNDCINYHYAYTYRKEKAAADHWAEIFRTCKATEEQGLIYDFFHKKFGLDESGY